MAGRTTSVCDIDILKRFFYAHTETRLLTFKTAGPFGLNVRAAYQVPTLAAKSNYAAMVSIHTVLSTYFPKNDVVLFDGIIAGGYSTVCSNEIDLHKWMKLLLHNEEIYVK